MAPPNRPQPHGPPPRRRAPVIVTITVVVALAAAMWILIGVAPPALSLPGPWNLGG